MFDFHGSDIQIFDNLIVIKHYAGNIYENLYHFNFRNITGVCVNMIDEPFGIQEIQQITQEDKECGPERQDVQEKYEEQSKKSLQRAP